MTEQPQVDTTAQPREVLMSLTFDASPARVFNAWIDPHQVAKWWGPEQGFHTPLESVEIDLRVGGVFNLTMVQTDAGVEFPCRYEILELVEPELLVLSSAPMPEYGIPDATVTRAEFHAEADGRTRLVLSSGPYTEQMHGSAEAGWVGSLGTLTRFLGGSTAADG